jgi:hypothetical protein
MRKSRSLLGLAALTLPAVLFAPGTTHAAVGDLTCTESESVGYTPGLLNSARPVDVAVDNALSCLSLSDPGVTRGTVTATVPAVTRSCTDLAAATSGSYPVSWNNGRTSTISYHRSASYVLGTLVITETGTVTSGEFAGDTSVHVVELRTLNLLDCLSEPGLTAATGTGTYVFA